MRRRACLAAALAPALGGCALLPSSPMAGALRADAGGLPRRHHLKGVPFFAGQDTLCGPVTLAAAIQAAGVPADPAALAPRVLLPGRGGSLQTEMLAAPRALALVAVELPPRLDAVLATVAAGTPVVLLLNLGLSVWPRWHYALLTGHDLDRGEAWLHSGEQADQRWDLTPLETTWSRSGHWAFSVHRPGDWPPQVDEAAALQALLGLDRAGAPTPARLAAWRLAQARWPRRLSMAVGLAQALADDGQDRAAEAVLERWLTLGDSAVAWNNLAQLRLARGDRGGAQVAAARAVARARQTEPQWLDSALSTQREAEAR